MVIHAPSEGVPGTATAQPATRVCSSTIEFGFDRLEREAQAQASPLYYRLLDARTGRRLTAFATNIDFAAWADYLGDPPLATAFLDRLVDGAVILKLTGRSYRAHRARPAAETGKTDPA